MNSKRLPARKPPKADESLLGYLMRMGRMYHGTSPMAFLRYSGIYLPAAISIQTERVNLSRLGRVTGVDPERLAAMTYRPSRAKSVVQYFGQDIPDEMVTVHHRRACPECLKADLYHRASWDLSFNTACMRHQRWLLSACKRCDRRLNWHHGTLVGCICGSDYRRVRTAHVPDGQLYGLRYALKALNGAERYDGVAPGEVPGLMLFMGAMLSGARKCPRPIRLLSEPQRLNSLLNGGLPMLKAWPGTFFDYLDGLRGQGTERAGRYGLVKELGPIATWLMAPDFPPAIARPIRAALSQYLAERPELRTRARLARRAEASMTLREAAKVLRRSYATLAPGLRKYGLLVRDDGRGKGAPALIRREEVDALKAEMSLLRDKKQARAYLKVSKRVASAILSSKAIPQAAGPAATVFGRPSWRQADLQQLVGAVSRHVRSTKVTGTLFPVGVAISLAAHHGISFDTFLTRVDRAGGISGHVDTAKQGLSGISICPTEFRFILSGRADLSIPSAARELKVKQEVAYHLARKGILATAHVPTLPGKRISLSAIQAFRDRYVIPSQLNLDTGRYRGWAADQLIARGARPVSGPGVDNGRQYVFLSRDSKRLLQ